MKIVIRNQRRQAAGIELGSPGGACRVRVSLIPSALSRIEIAYSPDGQRVEDRICMTANGALLVAEAIERLVPADAQLVGVIESARYEARELSVCDQRDGNCVMISRANEFSPWIHLLTSGGHSVGGAVSLPLELASAVVQAIRALVAKPD